MAWFYNQVFGQNFEIGLVVTSWWLYSSAATMVRNFAFFLRNSQILRVARVKGCEKGHFSMAGVSFEF
jgi:hypothetical protein